MSLRPDDARARRPPGADRLAHVLRAGLRFTEQARGTGVANGEAPSPSLTNPPSKPQSSETRKRKAQESTNDAREGRLRLPCPPELRYKDGEILNVDSDARIRGASSEFRSTPLPIIPLDGKGPSTQDELIKFVSASGVKNEVWNVLRELYRKVGPVTEQSLPVPEPGKAYASSYDGNKYRKYRTQYYTQTLNADATVVHMVSGGEFWNEAQSGDPHGPGKLRTCHKGRPAYTTGMLWCNTSPNWQWKTSGDTAIRCRIHLPAGTQVIVDRSPVFGSVNYCDPEGRKSQFPDVLLLPGEFEITDVKRYKKDDYASDDDKEDDVAQKEKIQPRPVAGQKYVPGTEMTDEVYASRMLNRAVDNFLDVRLKVTRMMRVPDEKTSDFAFNH